MDFITQFKNQLFDINDETFEDSSLALYDYQYSRNTIYRIYCDAIKKGPSQVRKFEDIPFLPIEFFKKHTIKSTTKSTNLVFKSSATTSSVRSKHLVFDIGFYHTNCRKIFESLVGSLKNFKVIALLPSYLEMGDSSLISMINHFIPMAKEGSGFYKQNEVPEALKHGGPTLLFGVSYALLDLPEMDKINNLKVIETGGMKGRKKEMTRNELHQNIKKKTGSTDIWSEYGMTELFSQAYGKSGDFRLPPWATIKIRELNDPFSYVGSEKSGGINIIDLANIETCAFIETKDIGIVQKNNSFNVLGRFDNSDIRGCNLLFKG